MVSTPKSPFVKASVKTSAILVTQSLPPSLLTVDGIERAVAALIRTLLVKEYVVVSNVSNEHFCE